MASSACLRGRPQHHCTTCVARRRRRLPAFALSALASSPALPPPSQSALCRLPRCPRSSKSSKYSSIGAGGGVFASREKIRFPYLFAGRTGGGQMEFVLVISLPLLILVIILAVVLCIICR